MHRQPLMTVRLGCPGCKPSAVSWIPEPSKNNPTHVSDPPSMAATAKQPAKPRLAGWLAALTIRLSRRGRRWSCGPDQSPRARRRGCWPAACRCAAPRRTGRTGPGAGPSPSRLWHRPGLVLGRQEEEGQGKRVSESCRSQCAVQKGWPQFQPAAHCLRGCEGGRQKSDPIWNGERF